MYAVRVNPEVAATGSNQSGRRRVVVSFTLEFGREEAFLDALPQAVRDDPRLEVREVEERELIGKEILRVSFAGAERVIFKAESAAPDESDPADMTDMVAQPGTTDNMKPERIQAPQAQAQAPAPKKTTRKR